MYTDQKQKPSTGEISDNIIPDKFVFNVTLFDKKVLHLVQYANVINYMHMTSNYCTDH